MKFQMNAIVFEILKLSVISPSVTYRVSFIAYMVNEKIMWQFLSDMEFYFLMQNRNSTLNNNKNFALLLPYKKPMTQQIT